MNSKYKISGLELLRPNHAGAMELKNGRTVNYGVIRVNQSELVYFTGKGLREIWKPEMTDEERKKSLELQKLLKSEGGEKKLIDSQHISVIPLIDISRINF